MNMAMEVTANRRMGQAVNLGISPLGGQPYSKSAGKFEDVTTFRQDYTALPLESCRRKPMEPLPPASVIHKNSCYLKMQGSLTQNTYKPPNTFEEREAIVEEGKEGTVENGGMSKRLPNKMFATNFHLNADRRLDQHCTTNQEGFPPLVPQPLSSRHKNAHYKDVDSGPLGQRVLDPAARSEYNSVFRGEEGTGCERHSDELTRLPFLKTTRPRNTLTGTPSNGRAALNGEMVSTHRDTFKGEALPTSTAASESVRRQRQRITCIPQGDPNRVAVLRTNHQTSYGTPLHHQLAKPVGTLSSRRVNQSSIKLQDHTKPPSEYFTTTATQTFTQPDMSERASPLVRFSRNASFFPTGDLDPTRVKERLNHATTKSAHPQPPPGSFPAHVNSCNFHTESSVHIGWSKGWLHPSGTMAASYQPLSAVTHRAKAPSTDNLPLHYFSSVTASTTADSYRGGGGGDKGHKMKINTETINNLKSSHWALPDMGGSAYITTHRDCYTAPRLHAAHMG